MGELFIGLSIPMFLFDCCLLDLFCRRRKRDKEEAKRGYRYIASPGSCFVCYTDTESYNLEPL